MKTIARNGTGVKELADTFLSHFDFQKKTGRMDMKQKKLDHVYFHSLLKELALEKILVFIKNSTHFNQALEKIESGVLDPLSAAEEIVNTLIKVECAREQI